MDTIIEAKIRNEISNTLRIHVDGSWRVRDILTFYQSLQNLYDIYSYAGILANTKNSISKNYTDTELKVIGLLYQNILRREITIIATDDKYIRFSKKFPAQVQILNIVSEFSIKQISFASPGIHDITGAGIIIGHIKEVFLKLFEHKQSKVRRRLEDEKLELENQLLYLERNKKFIDILLEIGFTKEEVRKIISYENFNVAKLAELIESKKINNVEQL